METTTELEGQTAIGDDPDPQTDPAPTEAPPAEAPAEDAPDEHGDESHEDPPSGE